MPSFQPARRPPAPPTRPERWLREEQDGRDKHGGGPAGPGGPAEPDERPNRKWTATLGGLVIVLGALGAYDLLSGGASVTAAQTASPPASHAASPAASPGASGSPGGHPQPSRTPAASPTAHPSATGPAPASVSPSPAVTELSATSATAFGPDGTSDGDNASQAPRVLADAGSAWSSLWYKTPDFGKLQAGTGLLLDMGSEVSVSRVRVVLGDPVGTDLSLRVGDTPDPDGLSATASASDVGGTVRLSLSSPVRARYVLIWFTRLPPDSAGTYQVLVYSIKVAGHS